MKKSLLPLLALALAVAGCGSVPREPRNLSTLKQELVAYIDSGEYERQIARVAAEARAWIEQRAASAPRETKPTVVFDLDETLLMNIPHIRSRDFGYVTDVWSGWVLRGEAPPIEPVREVYRATRRLGIEVVFITGRRERERAGTEKNLRAIDCADYAALLCKPNDAKGSSAAFKTAERARLASEGRTIIANIGDQQSDLVGGFAERTFKLPNPFYIAE